MVLEIHPSSRSETLQHNHTHCTANIGFTEEELEQFSWGTRGLFEQMPANGDGYECYGDNCYGRPEVIQALKYVCNEWVKKYPKPRIGIGDISTAEGQTPDHSSHDNGLDVDIALVANTNAEIPLTYYDSKYSRQRTQELVDLFYNNPILGIRTILFNDPEITGVQPCDGHNNHLHVSFLTPGIDSAPYSSDQDGDLRLVIPPMQGERVGSITLM